MRRFLLVGLLWGSSAGAQEVRVPGPELAQAFERALTGLDVHLDCDVTGKDGKAIARSFVSLPEGLGGGRTIFSVPDQVVDLGALGRVVYQLRDVNLSKLQVRAREHDYVLTLWFEDQGYELVPARARGEVLGQLAPDVQMDRMKLELSLTPKQGTAQIAKGQITFDADIRPAAEGLAARLESVDAYAGLREALRREIEKQINQSLASPELLAALNARLKQELGARVKSGQVAGARFDGTDVVVTVKPEK
jgi:hypothetical protein